MLEVAEGTKEWNVQFDHNMTFKERRAKKRLYQTDNSLDDLEQMGKLSKWDEQTYDVSPDLPTSGWCDSTFPPGSAQPPLHRPQPPPEHAMSLFQWQVYQEALRLARVPVELLRMQDEDGDTCLHIAVAQGRRALAFVLAEKMAAGGVLETREHNAQTALQVAAATNQHLIISDLLAHGAQVDTQDIWGRSPLHVCAEKGHFLSLQSIWKTLVELGRHVDPEVLDYDGLTPLHVAVSSHNNVVNQLRTVGNSCSRQTNKLLRKKMMFSQCVRTLLTMGATCGAKELKSGRTSVHMAAEAANMELLRLFLQQPLMTVVNAQTFSGNTPLHLAISLCNNRDHLGAVKLLLRKGANPGIRNFEKEQPSQLVPEGPLGQKVWNIL